MKTIIVYCLLNACSVVNPGEVSLKQCNQLIIEGSIPECRISKDGNTSCRCELEVNHEVLRQAASPT